MDAAEIRTRRLHNLQLSRPLADSPVATVSRMLALQAQDDGPARWSVGQRGSGLAESAVDSSVENAEIVRTHVLRPTWHFVAARDLRWLLALTGPRVQRANVGRCTELGLDARTLDRCAGLVAGALTERSGLTRTELGQVLRANGVDPAGQRLPYILMHCELEAVICGGGGRGRDHRYVLVDEAAPRESSFFPDEPAVELASRYLAGHGPASLVDLRWWSGLKASTLREAVSALGDQLGETQVEDTTFWWIDEEQPEEARGARLLHTYDEYVVGFTGSRFVGDPRREEARAAWRDRRLPGGILLIDGLIAGHWRRKSSSSAVTVQLTLYEDLDEPARDALSDEVAALGRFLGKPAKLERLPSAL